MSWPTELNWVTTRRLAPPLQDSQARKATAALAALHVVALDAASVLAAVDTATANTIGLWDAMVVQAAQRAGCDEILTEALNHGQIIDGVRVTNPFESA